MTPTEVGELFKLLLRMTRALEELAENSRPAMAVGGEIGNVRLTHFNEPQQTEQTDAKVRRPKQAARS